MSDVERAAGADSTYRFKIEKPRRSDDCVDGCLIGCTLLVAILLLAITLAIGVGGFVMLTIGAVCVNAHATNTVNEVDWCPSNAASIAILVIGICLVTSCGIRQCVIQCKK